MQLPKEAKDCPAEGNNTLQKIEIQRQKLQDIENCLEESDLAILSQFSETAAEICNELNSIEHQAKEIGEYKRTCRFMLYEMRTDTQLVKERVRQCILSVLQPGEQVPQLREMPSEILGMIANRCRDSLPAAGTPKGESSSICSSSSRRDVSDIQNLRLVCRRLHDASSHLLLESVKVQMNQESLDRLEGVCSRPHISKAVRTVSIEVIFYSPWCAASVKNFLEAQMTLLLESEDNGFRRPPGRVQDQIISWRNKDSTVPYLLQRCFKKYRELFERQEHLWKNGEFSKGIREAFERMPHVKRLEICDGTYPLEQGTKRYKTDSDDEALLRYITKPVSWAAVGQHGSKLGLGPRPFREMLELLIAARKAGTHLESLTVRVYLPSSIAVFSEKDFQDLRVAIQGLKMLTFYFSLSRRRELKPTIALMTKYFNILVDAENLEKLEVRFGPFGRSLHRRPARLFDWTLDPTSEMHQWPKLTTLSLKDIQIHMDVFVEFIKHLPESLREFEFDFIWLMDGAWETALELIRERFASGQTVKGFTKLYGVEFGKLGTSANIALRKNQPPVDGVKPLPMTQILDYASRKIDENPLSKIRP